MTKEQLYRALDYVDHSRDNRLKMANVILGNPNLVEPLLEIAFDLSNPVSHRACWVLEFTAKEELSYLYPYVDIFVDNLGRLKIDSSIRPAAKICEYFISCYFLNPRKECRNILKDRHLQGITTACFDWLIGDHKVAAKVYSMTSLLYLGKKFPWIHPELVLILEQNYAGGSAAYKARARHTLAKLNEFKKKS